MADLFGQWRMVSGETVTEGDPEVWNFTASEMEIDRRLTFHSSWDETEPDGVDYYDEWHPGYLEEAQAMAVEYQETQFMRDVGTRHGVSSCSALRRYTRITQEKNFTSQYWMRIPCCFKCVSKIQTESTPSVRRFLAVFERKETEKCQSH